MLKSSIVHVVDICTRYPWWVIALAVTLSAASAAYTARHIAIKTDVDELISSRLPWSQRERQFSDAFPQREILVVVDAPTPEFAERAAGKLADGLEAQPNLFRVVSRPQSGSFFERNGLLYLPTDEVRRVTDGLTQADALLEMLAADPTLRGTLEALSSVLIGVERKELKLDDVTRPLTMAADTAEAILAGRPTSFSWRVLTSDDQAELRDLRRFIEIEPVLDFSALEPGRAATDAIARIALDLKLTSDYQARVHQTGLIPIGDDEFGSIKQNAGLNATVSVLAVLGILWLALRSGRIMFAVVASITIGLVISTAWGLLLVGPLNLISIAFFMLFVGLGIDFGIQFSVRYRAERHDNDDLRTALHTTAVEAGGPLALAAAATAVGFSSFLPTDYRGLSELGQMAGSGMIIAFITSITVLPALLVILNPRGEPHPMGFAFLAPVDRFLERHRIAVVVLTVVAVIFASPLLLFLRFDFNPLHLRNPEVESVATFLELRKDPLTGVNSVEIMAPDLASADATAQKVVGLPQVSRTVTLSDFVPVDQDQKLKLIHDAAATIDTSLNPKEVDRPPTDQENVEAISSTADTLAKVAGNDQGPGADAARRLSMLLSQLARADASVRKQTETNRRAAATLARSAQARAQATAHHARNHS